MKKLTNNNFSKSKGFTLIELVVVIVILGILAATAAPKFIDLTGDAKSSVMQGVKGSIESAVSMVHAKAIVSGKTAAGAASVEINGVHYALYSGYPAPQSTGAGDGTSATAALGILGLLDMESSTDGSTGDFKVTEASSTTTYIQHASVTTGTACRLTYTRSVSSKRPVITESLDDC